MVIVIIVPSRAEEGGEELRQTLVQPDTADLHEDSSETGCKDLQATSEREETLP